MTLSVLPQIASLWIGGRLSWLEQLCLRSFVDAGHHVTLFSYTPIDNVPDGIETEDAATIFVAPEILRHTRTGSPAIHADIWRLHMVRKTGKIWVDADMYCYRPFDFDGPHVFGWEKPGLVCNAVLGLPPDSPALAGLLAHFDAELGGAGTDGPTDGAHLGKQDWGSTGPKALTDHLTRSGEIDMARSQDVFFPVLFKHRNHMILNRSPIDDRLTDETRGIHFWARRMKPRLAEKENNRPRPGSFLDGLIKKHGIDPARAPIPGWDHARAPDTPATNEDAATRLLLDHLRTARLTRVVDVGANPLSSPPYQRLLDLGGCEVIGFEPHPAAFAELKARNSTNETYFPFAVGDGSRETLHVYRESGLTSVFAPYEGALSYLGRSRHNISLVEDIPLETRRLDSIDDIDGFDLLKIDIQGGEVKVFQGGSAKLASAVAVIPEVRFYQLYEDEPMFGGIDTELRRQGFQLHKITHPKGKVIPNSQIARLKRFRHRNQIIDADAVYLRDPGRIDSYSDEQLKHLAILATAVFESFDLAIFCLDELIARGAISADLPGRYVDCLPDGLRKN